MDRDTFVNSFIESLSKFDPDKAKIMAGHVRVYSDYYINNEIDKAISQYDFPISDWYVLYRLASLNLGFPQDGDLVGYYKRVLSVAPVDITDRELEKIKQYESNQ